VTAAANSTLTAPACWGSSCASPLQRTDETFPEAYKLESPGPSLQRDRGFSFHRINPDIGKATLRSSRQSFGGKGAKASWILGSSSGSDCRLSPRARCGSSHSARKSEIPKGPITVPESDSVFRLKRRLWIQTLPKESGE
jgi:hypothetical protein